MESLVSDDELIGRVKRGERQAYEDLVRRYQDVAFRTAWIIVRDAGEAEDVTQAAFIKAWLAIDRFRKGAPFRPWLLRIVANEAKNRHKVLERHRFRTDGERAADAIAAAHTSPEDALIEREHATWLVSHINRLNQQDRTVIYYKYALDLPEAEIASVLGCARGTVKSRLHRALGRLRERLEEPS